MKANRYIAKTIYALDQLDKITHSAPPCLIISAAGFGKTSTIRLYCDYMGYNLVTIIPSQSTSDDILGLQSVQDGKLVRLTPSWFNHLKEVMKNGKRTVLFIDEISTCDSYIQGPLLDLIFSHNLGEETLPENCFIVAAGNRSSDLNNDFRMTAPLVNRFLILNLEKTDYSINEILNNTFTELKTKKDVGKFLGLEKSKDFKPLYNYEKFVNWIKTGKEVVFGKTQYEEDEDIGLLGFTSVRSLTYCLQFTKEYFNTFDDNDWIRVVGDTLGTSNKRDTKQGNGMPMRTIIDTYKEDFIEDDENKPLETIKDICTRMKCMKISMTDVKKLNALLDVLDPKDITPEDIKAFCDLNDVVTADVWEDKEMGFIELVEKFTKIANQAKAKTS